MARVNTDPPLPEEPDEPDGQRAERSLRRGAAWIVVGNIAFAISQWVVLAVLARMGTVEQVGEFALANAIAAPVFMLSDLNLRTYLATDARDEFSFSTYFSCRVGAAGIALSSLVVAGALLRTENISLAVLAGIGATKAFESLSTIVIGLFQKQERMEWVAGSLIVRSLLGILAFSSTLYVWSRLEWAVAALAASRLVAFMLFDLPLGRRLTPFVRGASWRDSLRLARTALPLGGVMMLISLNANAVVYGVEILLGTAAVGRFAALHYLISSGRIVITAIAQTAGPRLSRHLRDGEIHLFERLQSRLVLLGLAIGLVSTLGTLVVGEPILSLIYSPDYGEHYVLLAWLFAGNSFSFANAFLGAGLTAMRSFGRMLLINVVSVALTGACIFLLVPSFGLTGAAWTVGVSAASKLGLNLILNHRARAQRGDA